MKYIKKIIANPLFSGSMIMIVGSNITNVIAYVYNFLLGRLLGRELYGEVATLISLLGLLTATFGFFGVVIVKFTSSVKESKLKPMLDWFDDISSRLALLISILVLLSSYFISKFLHTDVKIILIFVPLIYFSVKNLVLKSILNGLLRFKQLVIVQNFDMLTRLILSVMLVYLGFATFGVMTGFAVSAFLGVLATRFFLRDIAYQGTRDKFKDKKAIFKFNFPIFANSLATMSFFSIDLILARHFFSVNSQDVGTYASLSNMGKIIFFSLAPVSSVMFPLVSNRDASGRETKSVLFLSTSLVSLGVLFVLTIYRFFPMLILRLLWGNDFIIGSEYLFSFGLIMSIFSLNNLFLNYFVSKGKIYPILFSVLCSTFQIVGIVLFHNSIWDFISVSFVSVLIFSFCLVIYTVYETKAFWRK